LIALARVEQLSKGAVQGRCGGERCRVRWTLVWNVNVSAKERRFVAF